MALLLLLLLLLPAPPPLFDFSDAPDVGDRFSALFIVSANSAASGQLFGCPSRGERAGRTSGQRASEQRDDAAAASGSLVDRRRRRNNWGAIVLNWN